MYTCEFSLDRESFDVILYDTRISTMVGLKNSKVKPKKNNKKYDFLIITFIINYFSYF
jgi:hypothetical protein